MVAECAGKYEAPEPPTIPPSSLEDLDVPPVSVKGKTPVGPTNAHEIIAVGQGRTWSKPQAGWTKLNCDGSFDDKAAAGSGMVLRDSDGLIIFSSCRQLFNCRDPLEAELGACMEGSGPTEVLELNASDCNPGVL
ncbi:Long chain acyl-CoA synthetase 9, chloroplastic [Hordeum vulgare]|nr:Long chain acyl-CoA synthetase 9, chloroplastic [Hordeum vulgare]